LDAEFVAFVDRRAPRHVRAAALLTGDWHDAEDLVQTCLVKLYRAGRDSTREWTWTPTCVACWSTPTGHGGGRGGGERLPWRPSPTVPGGPTARTGTPTGGPCGRGG